MKRTCSLRSIFSSSFRAVGVTSLMLTFTQMAHAQAYLYWDGGAVDLAGDGDGASAGGNGIWDTTIQNWDAGAVPFEAWDNSANNFAAFGGAGPYTVTLGADVTVGRFAFNAAGGVTTIVPGAGPYGITLGGAAVNVEFSNGKLGAISADVAAGSSNIVVGSTAGSSGGILTLSGAVTGTGNVTVTNGTLLKLSGGSSLTSGNLALNNGGILGLDSGNFSRGIGTGAGQVQWGTTAGAGFAAFGANRTVNLGGGSINWTAANFIGGGRTLFLSHETSDATLIWQKAVSLAGGGRTISVADGSALIDAELAAVFAGGSSGTANSLTKAGLGTLALTAQNTHWGNTTVSAGTLMIGNGGTTGGVSQNSPNVIVAAGATLAANRSNTLTQGTNALNAPISGAGNFAQVGSGTTILTLDNTYQGTTTVSHGILRIDGTHTGGGDYTVADGGTLQGSGSTTSALNVSGVLSPGASVGSFASGTLNLLAGATFEVELDSSVAMEVGADLQVVSGALNLTGVVELSLVDLAASPVAFGLGTTLSLMSYSGAWNGGLFTYDGDEIANGAELMAGLNTWRLDYDADSGGLNYAADHLGGGSFVNLVAVPEPSTALLGALGALVLLRRRRSGHAEA